MLAEDISLGQSKEMIKARIDNQLDDEQKIAKSDFVINNIAKEDTHESVFQIHKAIMADLSWLSKINIFVKVRLNGKMPEC